MQGYIIPPYSKFVMSVICFRDVRHLHGVKGIVREVSMWQLGELESL